jgi:uncharacterized protein (DUF2249 family)
MGSMVELDNRGLTAPEPMVRILEALGKVGDGGVVRALMDHEPLRLYPELERRGCSWTFEERDGLRVITITKGG